MSDDSLWHVVLGFSVAVGLWAVARFGPRLFGKGPPKDMLEWQGELERAAIEAIRADLYAAQTKAALALMIGQMPEDFDATAFLGCRVAEGVHRACLREAEEQGLVRPGFVDEVYAPAAPPRGAPASAPGLRLVEDLPPNEWVEGRLVPRRRT